MPFLASERDEIDRIVTEVLSERRFQAPPESLWDRLLERATRWLGSLVGAVVDLLGGPLIAGILALALLVVLTAFAATRVARRRAARIEERISLDRLLEEGADPAELERVARDAAARGDHSRAVRALFVGGLLRLARRGHIRYRRGTTTAEIAGQLGSPTFDDLVRDFDEIAYGGRVAGASDLRRAEEGWRGLLEEARR